MFKKAKGLLLFELETLSQWRKTTFPLFPKLFPSLKVGTQRISGLVKLEKASSETEPVIVKKVGTVMDPSTFPLKDGVVEAKIYSLIAHAGKEKYFTSSCVIIAFTEI